MYKRRYAHSKLKQTIKSFNDDENTKEDFNLHTLDKEVKKIIKRDDPVEKFHKKSKKESKTKPINTRILLEGWVH